MFLHTTTVGPSQGHIVKRYIKGKSKKLEIAGPMVQQKYSENFNAVDRNDRDSADYTTSIKTNRWYLRIFFGY